MTIGAVKKRKHCQKAEKREARQHNRFMWAAIRHRHFVVAMRGHSIEPGRCRYRRAGDKQRKADHERDRRIAEDRTTTLSGTEVRQVPMKSGPHCALEGADDQRSTVGLSCMVEKRQQIGISGFPG